ncbi:hypothetical protein DSO57_1038544 [Entomophthora muscae]|uniref:Uncharacterized protein n=1 Tax=Entomophthora muscae TaxID=34485 RepID=A0ACC2SBT9_9FUNG|nr:hypothetical protein DSO57_1038544 [Entomophthora muscae]
MTCSKGKGFQGGMKIWIWWTSCHPWRFSYPSFNGSTGQRAQPGKVFKGKKMPGRMGGEFVTVKNARVYLNPCLGFFFFFCTY